MKRFLFICVALIAFLATNASGGNYQPTDQLQTYVVQQHFQITPAIVPSFETTPVVQPTNWIMSMATNQKEIIQYIQPAYANPDYGLYMINNVDIVIRTLAANSINRHTNKDLANRHCQLKFLSTEIVQLE